MEQRQVVIAQYERGEGEVGALGRRVETLFARMKAELAALETQRRRLQKQWLAARLARLARRRASHSNPPAVP